MNWVIYVLKDPRTDEVRYVGFTSQKPSTRLRMHISSAAIARDHTAKVCWINSLAGSGLSPRMEIIESGSGDGWKSTERRWVRHYRDLGAPLVNATVGGEGVPGWGTPEERSEAAKRAAASLTPESRAARSQAVRRAWATKTPEEIAAISKKRFDAMTPEQRRDRSRKSNAAMTPEQRSARAKLINSRRTPEQLTASSQKANANWTPERREEWKALIQGNEAQRVAAIRRYRSRQTPEERSALIRNWQARRTPEERKATMQKTSSHMTAEQRLARSLKAAAAANASNMARTPEERSEMTRKGHATRKAKAALPAPPVVGQQ